VGASVLVQSDSGTRDVVSLAKVYSLSKRAVEKADGAGSTPGAPAS
jgi:hypothetical protein